MTDFLTTLAGRTLGLIPETRPSLRSPFASEAAVAPETSPALDLAVEAAAPPAPSQTPAPTAPQPALKSAPLAPLADLSVSTPAHPGQSQRDILPSLPRQVRPGAEPVQSPSPLSPLPGEDHLVDSVHPVSAADEGADGGEAQAPTAGRPGVEVHPRPASPKDIFRIDAAVSEDEAAFKNTAKPFSRAEATQIIQRAPEPAPPALTGPGPKLSPVPEPPLVSPASAEPPPAGVSFSPPLVPPAVEPLATDPLVAPAPAPTELRDRPAPAPKAIRPENFATESSPSLRPERAPAGLAAAIDPSPLVASPATPATATTTAKPVARFPAPLPPVRPQLKPHRAEPGSERNGEFPTERGQTQPEPPTIQVTIGRIEVRATPPPQPAALPPAPARLRPALSLNDYLAKRREVKR